MTTVKLKIKINNSYESEPSSGSGSSASEANEYEHSTCEGGEVPNLPLMLNPGFYSLVNEVPREGVQQQKVSSPNYKSYDAQLNSSLESDFEGFPEEKIYNRHVKRIDAKEREAQPKCEASSQEGRSRLIQKVYTTYYDIVVEQNSCNAVDMQMCGENRQETSDQDKNLSEEPPSALSFNGKIKSLTSETSGNVGQQSACNSPKILKTILETTETSRYKYTNERSPDLFGDDDDDDKEGVTAPMENTTGAEETNKSLNCPTESSFADENTLNAEVSSLRKNIRREKELLKRIKTCLAGLPPPPSMTIPQLDLFSAITNNKADILNFNNEVAMVGEIILCEDEGLFKPSHTVEEVQSMPWKDILGVRQHGLSYNLCRASENIENLSLAVIERYIGAETSTSYTATFSNSPSSAKKRNLRLKMLQQSPGNRLSHLAKRRAAFSSANLASTSQKSSLNTSLGGMQILMDKKKGKSRRKGTTPKRMTPASKKKNVRKTPSSSARKRLFCRPDSAKPGPSRETSKRALFQSPAKQVKPIIAPPKPNIKPEIANRVEKSKRALFSPDKSSQSSMGSLPTQFSFDCGNLSQASQSSLFGANLDSLLLKRKRTEDDLSDIVENSKKIARREADILTPRSLKIKSQSFCSGAGSINSLNGSSNMLRSNNSTSTTSVFACGSSNGRQITRASSDTTFTSSSHLTENHRKKLLWAVSQALQTKQIGSSHSNFKQFASVLARVVRRLFQEYFQKSSSSTSDTMLRLARKHVFNVISGKSADVIYLYAKSRIEEERRMSSSRLSGYIAPEEYETRKMAMSQNSGLCNFENSIDSFSFSQNSSICLTQPAEKTSQSMENLSLKSAIKQQPIQPNESLQNSSSKNNLGGIALRENVDCELRRSAQKNFTGKDQRNVSPHVNKAGHSAKQATSCGGGLYELNNSTVRAKRQISFDS